MHGIFVRQTPKCDARANIFKCFVVGNTTPPLRTIVGDQSSRHFRVIRRCKNRHEDRDNRHNAEHHVLHD